jgi:type III pantothenate kinase
MLPDGTLGRAGIQRRAWGGPGLPAFAGPYDPRMLLAIDIGNTNLTLGIVEAGEVRAVRRAATPRGATGDELELLIGGLLGLDGRSLDRVGAVALVSVVPAATAGIAALADRHGLPVLVASAGTVPLAIRVDRPGDVGADRLVNALAVTRLHGTPAIVVDAGTATTFDAVGPDGAFLGGAIAPGLELGLEALAARTAKLPRVELRAPDRTIARDTTGAIRAGTVLGYQSLVEGLVGRMRAELAEVAGQAPGDVRVVLTGGLAAEPWARAITGVDAIDPDLTLKGLAILHAEVAGGEPLAAARR